MSEVKFVYNDGSSAHRGVWHMVKDAKVQVVEKKVTEYDSSYYNEKYINVHPEHEVHTVTTMCGQPRAIVTGNRSKWPRNNWSRKPSAEHRDVERVVKYLPPQYWPAGPEFPPQPLCSRCAKKAGVE